MGFRIGKNQRTCDLQFPTYPHLQRQRHRHKHTHPDAHVHKMVNSMNFCPVSGKVELIDMKFCPVSGKVELIDICG